MEKTHWKKVVSDPNYIGEADFRDGEEKILTIDRVNASEIVKTAEGQSKKAVLHFREQGVKPMILNVARSKSIEKVAGSPYFEDWPGVKIQLYIEHNIKAFGEIVNAVRVRPYAPKPPKIVRCDKCGADIRPGHGMTSEQMAAYTTKKYGAALCAACATEAAQRMKAEAEEERIAAAAEQPRNDEVRAEADDEHGEEGDA